ncbi:MAG: hemagglutinin repeat-containing protein [Rickettsiales bacterium]|jgi:hypothetical protein|nr:hemagglutinin repeat-containing protein [Rickettsiales bacterium]
MINRIGSSSRSESSNRNRSSSRGGLSNRDGSSNRDESSSRDGHDPIAADRVANMDKSDTVPRGKRISLFLCCLIIFNSIFTPLAQARIVSNRQAGSGYGQTVEENEENGIYTINIAAPNEYGVSYNSFESFSISADDNRKVLINNSPETLKNTFTKTLKKNIFTETLENTFSLNSMVESNPNVRWVDGAAASTIIFEIAAGESVNLNNSIIDLLGGENVTMIFASSGGMTIRETIFRGTVSRLDLIAGTIRISDENKFEFNIGKNGSMVFSAGGANNLSLSAPDVEEISLLGYTMQFAGEIFSREKMTIDSKTDINLAGEAKLKTGTLDILLGDNLKVSGSSSIETKNLRIKSEKDIQLIDRSTIDVSNDMEAIAGGLFELWIGSKIKVGNNFSLDVLEGDLKVSVLSSIETKNLRIKSGKDIEFSNKSTIDVLNDMEATAGGWFYLGGGLEMKVGNNFSLNVQGGGRKPKNGIWFSDGFPIDVSDYMKVTAGGWFLPDKGSKIEVGNNFSLDVLGGDLKVSGSSSIKTKNLRIKSEKDIQLIYGSTIDVSNDMEATAGGGLFELQGDSKIKVGNNFSLDMQGNNLKVSVLSSIKTKNLRIKSEKDIQLIDGSTIDVSNDMEATAGGGLFELRGDSKIKVGNNFNLDVSGLKVSGSSSIKAKDLRIKSGHNSIQFIGGSTIDVLNDMEVTARDSFYLGEQFPYPGDKGSKIKVGNNLTAYIKNNFMVGTTSSITTENGDIIANSEGSFFYLYDDSTVQSGRDIRAKANNFHLNSHSELLAKINIALETPKSSGKASGHVEISGAQVTAGRQLTIDGKTLSNYGNRKDFGSNSILENSVLKGNDVTLVMSDSIENRDERKNSDGLVSRIEAKNKLTIKTTKLENSAKIMSDKDINVEVNDLLNSNGALLYSLGSMSLKVINELSNGGRSIIATGKGDMHINVSSNLHNEGASTLQSGGKGEIIVSGNIYNIGLDSQGERYSKSVRNYDTFKKNSVTLENYELVDVKLNTESSKIISSGDLTIKTKGNLDNIGSHIISKYGTLCIIAGSLNNERSGFYENVKYHLHQHWTSSYRRTDNECMIITRINPIYWIGAAVSKKFRSDWDCKNTITDEHHRDGDAHNREWYYSCTPSIIFGRDTSIELTGDLHQDTKKMHRNSESSNSSLGGINSLHIVAKNVHSRGTLYSFRDKPYIKAEKVYITGGNILYGRGGIDTRGYILGDIVNLIPLAVDGIFFDFREEIEERLVAEVELNAATTNRFGIPYDSTKKYTAQSNLPVTAENNPKASAQANKILDTAADSVDEATKKVNDKINKQ